MTGANRVLKGPINPLIYQKFTIPELFDSLWIIVEVELRDDNVS